MRRKFGSGLPGLFKRTLALAGGTLALSLAANGATSIVTQPTEAALRDALAGGGSVSFACNGAIILSNAVVVTNDTVLDGSGYDVTITGQDRAFVVSSNVTFTAINFAIANSVQPTNDSSEPGGGILNDGGVLDLSGVSFLTNATVRGGGAIANRNGGTVNATNCTFAGNYAGFQWNGWLYVGWPAYGGAILNESGQVSLQTCLFCGNSAEGGPDYPPNGPPVNGGAAGFGGAIHNEGSLNVSGCTFQDNSAGGGGGFTWLPTYGSYPGASGTPGGPAFGGAICNLGTMALWSSTVMSNSAAGGGGGGGESGTVNYDTGQMTPSGAGATAVPALAAGFSTAALPAQSTALSAGTPPPTVMADRAGPHGPGAPLFLERVLSL
jgi:hypothetical protein